MSTWATLNEETGLTEDPRAPSATPSTSVANTSNVNHVASTSTASTTTPSAAPPRIPKEGVKILEDWAQQNAGTASPREARMLSAQIQEVTGFGDYKVAKVQGWFRRWRKRHNVGQTVPVSIIPPPPADGQLPSPPQSASSGGVGLAFANFSQWLSNTPTPLTPLQSPVSPTTPAPASVLTPNDIDILTLSRKKVSVVTYGEILKWAAFLNVEPRLVEEWVKNEEKAHGGSPDHDASSRPAPPALPYRPRPPPIDPSMDRASPIMQRLPTPADTVSSGRSVSPSFSFSGDGERMVTSPPTSPELEYRAHSAFSITPPPKDVDMLDGTFSDTTVTPRPVERSSIDPLVKAVKEALTDCNTIPRPTTKPRTLAEFNALWKPVTQLAQALDSS
ncbi:hypothetical protein D9611_003737 [Ephemerocybe angulata]|uniref:Uncharacterized protein n=1 Tax=Ephemerocybe angulata TaxID=980116 RepID=A0A8H5EYF9_9AGAR|nr:hypothetical protein D9611_003737 [Tulosesus angulatus]